MPQYFGQLPITNQPWSTLGAIQNVKRDRHNIELKCGSSRLIISVLAQDLIRVRLTPSGDLMPRRSWAVTRDDEEWAIATYRVRQEGQQTIVATSR